MKKIITISILVLIAPIKNICLSQNLPRIDKETKSFYLYMENDDDTPLIFGYSLPNVQSEKIICFSSATSDIENNPNKCKLGSYYETSDIEIEYDSTIGDFIKLKLKSASNKDEYFYIKKSRVIFE